MDLLGWMFFFVISGFLMTGIIVRGLQQGNFSFWDFLGARVRRIFPALMALCVALIVLGWWLFENNHLKLLLRQIWSSIIFFSNFSFSKEAGYFDQDSHDQLLLHTWSLSNEWQFYLLLPLFLMLVWKFCKSEKNLWVALAATCLISFVASVFLSEEFPTASFYLLPARAWEMLVGGLVFFAVQRFQIRVRIKKIIGGVAFFVIFLCFFLVSPEWVWPGYGALLPVSATAFLIFANGKYYFLENPVAQWLGKNSYSIYLWHWLLVVILHYRENVTWYAQWGFVVLSVILGAISFRCIEVPGKNFFKKGGAGQMRICVAFAMLLALSYVAYKNVDVPWRISGELKSIYDEAHNTEKCEANEKPGSQGCIYGGAQNALILIGDSHAVAMARSVSRALPSPELHLLDFSQRGCPTVEGIQYLGDAGWDCHTSSYIAQVKAAPAGIPVLIVNRYGKVFHGQNEKVDFEPETFIRIKYADDPVGFAQETKAAVISTACQLAENRPVYMLRMIPELRRHVPAVMGRGWRISGESTRVSISEQEYEERTRAVHAAQDAAAAQCGVHVLDPAPYLCRDGRCWGDVDGVPVYFDDDHLSRRGADLLIPEFQKIFAPSLAGQRG